MRHALTNTFHLYCLPWGCIIPVFPLIYYQACFLLAPEWQGSVSESARSSEHQPGLDLPLQGWAQGHPWSTLHVILGGCAVCSVECSVESQDLPPGECPSVSVMQQRNRKQGRTGEMEILPFRSLPGSQALKSVCHTSPCRKSSMLSEGRQGVQRQ